MERMQDVVLAKLEENVKHYGFKPLRRPDYGNNGNIAVCDRETLDVLGVIHYDFQTIYFSIDVYNEDRRSGQKPVVGWSTITNRFKTSEILEGVTGWLIGLREGTE